jgi:hypothetical protein
LSKQKIVFEDSTTTCWAVVDHKYGVVALYWSKKEAQEACDKGDDLDSGYVGHVEEMKIKGTPPKEIQSG